MTSVRDVIFAGLTLALLAGVELSAGQTITKDTQCGVTLGCYDDCTATSCNFAFTWKTEGMDLHFNFKALRADDQYIALGFATTSAMAGAGVLECVVVGGNVKVYESRNAASSRANTRLSSPEAAITALTGTLTNGILECDFKRKTSGTSDADSLDLNTDYFLMMARGTATASAISKHTDKSKMATKTDFQMSLATTTAANGETTTSHGSPQVSRMSLCVLLGAIVCVKWIWGFHV